MATKADELGEKLKKMSDEQKKREKVTISFSQLEEFGETCGTTACKVYTDGLKEDAKKGIFPDIAEVKAKIDELNKMGSRIEGLEKEFAKIGANADGARTEAFNVRKQNERIAGTVFEIKEKLDKFEERAAKNVEPAKPAFEECPSCHLKADEKVERAVGVCTGDAKNGFACTEPRPKFDSHDRELGIKFCPACGSNVKNVSDGKLWFDLYQEAQKKAETKK